MRTTVLLSCAFLILSSCSMPTGVESNRKSPDERNQLILDELKVLDVGEGTALKLNPGMYRLEMTASGGGVTVQWVGAECLGSSQLTTSLSTVCELAGTGQLVVKNPSFLGLGAATSVTLKVTRLAIAQ